MLMLKINDSYERLNAESNSKMRLNPDYNNYEEWGHFSFNKD